MNNSKNKLGLPIEYQQRKAMYVLELAMGLFGYLLYPHPR
jgi:hypothetical protein